MTDLLSAERARIVSRLISVSAVHATYCKMALADHVSPGEKLFLDGEVARVLKEMLELQQRLQQIDAIQPPSMLQ